MLLTVRCCAVTINKLSSNRASSSARIFTLRNHVYWRPQLFTVIEIFIVTKSQDSSVRIAAGYGQNGQGIGVRFSVWTRILICPYRRDRLWAPPNLLSIGYRGLFSHEKSGRRVKLTTHLQPEPMSRKLGSIHPLPPTF
jgi:hypothetical protein